MCGPIEVGLITQWNFSESLAEKSGQVIKKIFGKYDKRVGLSLRLNALNWVWEKPI